MVMNFTLTPAAEKFIRFMLRADGAPGGCSGLSADIGVAAAPDPGEAIVERNGLKLFLNAESRLLLDGVTIDFADSAAKTGLVFNDPKQVCCSSQAGKSTH